MFLLILLVFMPIVGLVFLFRSQIPLRRVTIVVLGDIGRSPRMQYHALSFVKQGFNVDLVGYGGSTPHKDIVTNKKISIYHLKEPPETIQRLPRLLVYIIKSIWQSLTLSLTLLLIRKPSYLLLQNPPAIPSMAVCWLVTLIRNNKFIIDWHNYGHTILSLALGDNHLMVRFAKWYEYFFGRLSHANICVTRAMRNDLQENWNISAVTMYDRPPSIFRKTDLITQQKLFSKLSKDYQVFRNENNKTKGATTFTLPLPDGTSINCSDRPALLVSSTSWTPDEDFSILLRALEDYELIKSEEGTDLPDIVCVITGKGPQRRHYQSVIMSQTWNHVRFCTPWLEADDYPKLLGSADLGVCLHTSSSGLDLPMKVVDMFGCGLPVCAVHFKCLNELVIHEKNGLVFKTAEELSLQIQDLLRGFPEKCEKLETFRRNIKTFQAVRWDDSWKQNVLPLLDMI